MDQSASLGNSLPLFFVSPFLIL
ncbi:hypothetical protein F383_31177 [Gossypium arboreum]|uniref:Uncharacterized protein n=1 Tax=Gossypium arboreum TaxID=29729 RepID=A0A0B0N2I5_GOSAR|nr:hypothetical protein F383_31177 [Gossypium arboreum]